MKMGVVLLVGSWWSSVLLSPSRMGAPTVSGTSVTGVAALAGWAGASCRLHLRGQELSLRDIAARLVIATGKKKGQHPSPATVMRMLR
jgi:hypothetical protein